MIKVLVVDDHDLVRTGITRMLADIEGLQWSARPTAVKTV